jgi:precorrin-4/cobalt-precorrin-4 C11-methyltransferase
MVIFLSIAHIDQVAAELREGGYPPGTPITVAYRVTWEDQAIWHVTLDTVVELVRRERIARQALLMVGPVFDPAIHRWGVEQHSHLYDAAYTHMFRKGTWRRPSKEAQ